MSCWRDQIRSSARGHVYNQHSSVNVFSVETGAALSDVDLVSQEGQKKKKTTITVSIKTSKLSEQNGFHLGAGLKICVTYFDLTWHFYTVHSAAHYNHHSHGTFNYLHEFHGAKQKHHYIHC